MPDVTSREPSPQLPFHTRRFHTLEGTIGFDQPEKLTIDADTIKTTADIEALHKEGDARRTQKERNDMFYYLAHDLNETAISDVRGSSENPVPSVQERLENAEKLNANELRREIELNCNAKITEIEAGKRWSAENETREKLEPYLWNRKPITRVTGSGNRMFYLNTMDDLENLLGLAKERQIVFDYCIGYFRELKKGYEGLLAKLTDEAPKVVAEKLAEIRATIKDGGKTKSQIEKTIARYRKKPKISKEKAVQFDEDCEHFKTLQLQYIALVEEINKYGNVAIPSFPSSPKLGEYCGAVSEIRRKAGRRILPGPLEKNVELLCRTEERPEPKKRIWFSH